MDTDENKALRASTSIPIAGGGKKPERDAEPTNEANPSSEDEQLREDLFGAREDEDQDEGDPEGGLFGEDENGENYSAVSAHAQRLADLVMQVDTGRAFNPQYGGGNRWKEYLTGLESGDEMAQLDSLINLADELCVMTEETANGFKLDQFLPALVALLNTSDNPNSVLLACRCMSHILEALPGSENAFVRNDAIPGLVEKLLNIEYDDLRDQAMNVLSRLCQSPLSASAVLKNGGLCAILANLDFSAINTQVVAVTCASNMLRLIPNDAWPQVRDALPTLAMLLQYEDPRLVEKSTVSLASICTHFISDSSKLEAVVNSGALPNLVRLVTERSEKSAEVSNLTWMVIRCLATLCRGLPTTAEMLIATGVPSILKNMLLAERENATKGIRQSAKTNTQAVYDMVALADQLLPPLPTEVSNYLKSTQVQPTYSTGRARGLFQPVAVSEIDVLASGSIPIPSDGAAPENDARYILYQKQPSTLLQVAENLLSTMTLVFGSRVNPQLRIKCLSTIAKIVFACTPEMLATLLKDLTFSSFIASLLSSKDLKFIAVALSIAENLMGKLPDIFSAYFTREGVVHEVEQLLASGAQFKAASRTATPTATPSTPVISSTPGDAYITPLTPNAAPSFMWEALASPPNPSMMKARFGSKDTAFSVRGASPSQAPISFGSPSPATASEGSTPSTPQPSSASIQFGFDNGSSTPQPAKKTDSSAPIATPSTPTGSSVTISTSIDAPTPANSTEILRLDVVDKCAKFKQKYFSVDVNAATEGLDQLATLSESLTNCLWTEKDASKLKETLALAGDLFLSGISTHEFVRSSLPSAIFQFLTLPNDQVPITRHERLLMFIHTFGKKAKSNDSSLGPTSPWRQLVKELHNAIDKNENFQVKLNPAMTNGGIRANTIVEFLTKAFSVKLVRDPSQTTLPAIYEGPVSVEPLATGRSVKDFVASKIKQAVAQEEKKKRADEAKKKAAETARAESAMPVSTRTRSKTEENNDAESSAATDGSTPQKKTESASPATPLSSSGASSSANEADHSQQSNQGASALSYEDVGDDEEDLDTIDDEMDNGDQGVYVQEVDGTEETDALANAASHSSSSPSSQTPSSGSRASRKSKSASNAHMFSSSDLVLVLDGIPLPDTLSIFKALKDNSVETGAVSTDSEVATPLAPMWSQTHTIHYKLSESALERFSEPKTPSSTPDKSTRSDSKKKHSASSSSASSSALSTLAEISPSFVNTPSSMLRAESECAALDRVLETLMSGEIGEACGFEKTLVQLLSLTQVLATLSGEVPKLVPGLQLLSFADEMVTVLPSEYINAKLTAKLARQLQDPIALCTNTLPSWCASLCSGLPFLFPLDLRQLYFRGSSLGIPRALMALKDRVEGVLDGNFGRITPHKVRVARESIPQLNTAFVVLQRIRDDSRSMLEVEYFNEVATGAGPTLEFYTLVSHAFQQSKLAMWVPGGADRVIKSKKDSSASTMSSASENSEHNSSAMDVDEHEETTTPTKGCKKASKSPSSSSSSSSSNKKKKKEKSDEDNVSTAAEFMQLINNKGGLFPRPLFPETSSSSRKDILKRFSYLGTFISKAIMDDRMMDMPFSVAFFKGLLGQPLQLGDLAPIYPELVQTIRDFTLLVEEKKNIETDTTIDAETKTKRIQAILYKGKPIEDMWLTFELPGSREDLVPNGSQRDLTIHNLAEWIDLVVDAIGGQGVKAQFDALREGFSYIFSVNRLNVFDPSELETLICGSVEQDWTRESILEAANYTHGFTVNSKVSQWFATLLSEFTEPQRRQFLQFATGSPRLPPRGFKGFHHRLTLSRKDAEKSRSSDDYYPSVSTCFLFIKIPDYSSYEIFKVRFLTAVENGQQGFGLS